MAVGKKTAITLIQYIWVLYKFWDRNHKDIEENRGKNKGWIDTFYFHKYDIFWECEPTLEINIKFSFDNRQSFKFITDFFNTFHLSCKNTLL